MNMDDRMEIIDTTYLQYCSILNDIDRAIEKAPEKKARMISSYTSAIREFCKTHQEMTRVVIADNKKITGIESTDNGHYYHTTRQYGRPTQKILHSDDALDLSVLAIQMQLDIENETITGLHNYLKNEGRLEQNFERCASAVYQKVMHDKMANEQPKIEKLFDDEEDCEDIKVEKTDPSYRPRTGSHCSGVIDTDKKNRKLEDIASKGASHTPEYHAKVLSIFN